VEQIGLDRPRRHHINRDAVSCRFQCPSARHAKHTGFRCRIGGTVRSAERGARSDQNNSSEMPLLHAWEGGLDQYQRRAEMELTKRSDVVRRRLLDQIGPDDPGIVDDVRNGMPGRYIPGGIRRRLRIEQIHQNRLQPWMRPVREAPVERDDLVTISQHRLGDGPADAAAGARDDGDVALAHDVLTRGVYSQKYKSLADLPEGAKVAIANDPSNGARGLMILALHGAIKLKDPTNVASTVADITDNPKKLRFIELDAAQLPRSLQDVDLVSINNNYAVQAGLNPAKDAIARENPDGPWVNILAVRDEDKDKPWVKQLIDAYHSEPVKAFIETRFKGTYIPTW
jgi:hypothetical protein